MSHVMLLVVKYTYQKHWGYQLLQLNSCPDQTHQQTEHSANLSNLPSVYWACFHIAYISQERGPAIMSYISQCCVGQGWEYATFESKGPVLPNFNVRWGTQTGATSRRPAKHRSLERQFRLCTVAYKVNVEWVQSTPLEQTPNELQNCPQVCLRFIADDGKGVEHHLHHVRQ